MPAWESAEATATSKARVPDKEGAEAPARYSPEAHRIPAFMASVSVTLHVHAKNHADAEPTTTGRPRGSVLVPPVTQTPRASEASDQMLLPRTSPSPTTSNTSCR